ncbi:uncharacterized protein ACNS7B_001771 isoform 2-T2 [Menidia menidia]
MFFEKLCPLSSWTLPLSHLSQTQSRNMLNAWILLPLLFTGGRTFMIHNSQRSLCLEDSVGTGEVLLKRCNLDSESQQWVWLGGDKLMCVASSRCLSSERSEPVQTQPCHGPDVDAAGSVWDCDNGRLISKSSAMFLSISGQQLILTKFSQDAKWKSLDEGDICQERLRVRRASDDSDLAEYEDEPTGELASMTEEQREYLRWYYRTEDPTTWKFVLLGAAFICLLVGFLLLGMGAVANKSRKKIAKYKAAASFRHESDGEELRAVLPLRDNGASPQHCGLLSGRGPTTAGGEEGDLKAGDIVVTWKDGNISSLYSDHAETEKPEEEEKEEDVKREEKGLDVERDAEDAEDAQDGAMTE